ncbi:MAG: CoB--CoM heterodisulfide reductase iron-sulfur subunit A family protein [Archaeoglobaceae archaeon]|uniref:CoB--CoM heterodisulfide reductase iron-sulfur subunit A n=1 Tax=Archaeoglobus fulgidus TaxID=2234 RepID=A0A7J3M194_ARCFL
MGGEILVIGGGIAGLTSAVEASETGYSVVLVEKTPFLGGRVAQLNKYFPKLCPPFCGLEIFYKRMRTNPKLKVFTNAEVMSISGNAGDFSVSLRIRPRFVNENCTACGECAKVCPIEVENEYDFGLSKRKAIYLPHAMAMPFIYAIDENKCNKCGECVKVCKYNAINLNDTEKTLNLKVSAIIVATGWKPYDAKKLTNLGYGKFKNVVTNMEFERLASLNGPTKGKILSNGKPITSIAFAQCAGSRDENHLPYCSAVCCLASLKQATYVRDQYADAKIYIFYIDIRAFGRYEDFFAKVAKEKGIELIKGKVAKVEERDGKLIVTAEDTATGQKIHKEVDMLVLATGMQPSLSENPIPGIEVDEYGFVKEKPGIIPAGVAMKPLDVMFSNETATSAVLKAIQLAKR